MVKDGSRMVTLRDGRKLGYIEYGDPDGKSALFFFHGWPGSRYSGKETDSAAKKLGVRVISPDRPGMGMSDFQPGRTMLDWPNDVGELADYLHIRKFSVLGVSGGGPYAAACASGIPQRISKAGIVAGLAPVDVPGNLDGMAFFNRLSWANYHRFPCLTSVAAICAAIEFRYVPFIGSLIAFPNKEDRRLFRDALRKQAGEGIGVREAFRQGTGGPALELSIYSGDWGFRLGDIKTKTYLWYGALDKCVSLNMGKYYHSQIPGSELYIDKDGTHLSRYEFEERIIKTLRR